MTTFFAAGEKSLLEVLRNMRNSLYKYIIDGGEQALFNAVMDLYNYIYNMTSFDHGIFREKCQVFYTLLKQFNEENDDIFEKEQIMCSNISYSRIIWSEKNNYLLTLHKSAPSESSSSLGNSNPLNSSL
jgi:hypothetical protein